MSIRTPYLLRRGDTFAFRIAVPADLRATLQARELVRSLRTGERRIALPRALLLASKALRLFAELRAMPRDKRESVRVDFGLELSLDELGLPTIKVTDAKPEDAQAIALIAKSFAESKHSAPTASSVSPSPMLSQVIDDFLAEESKRGIEAMMRKHRAVMPMFIEVIGDKPVAALRQTDVVEYFGLVHRLPPHWKSIQVQRRLSVRHIAGMNHDKLLAEKSFIDTYRVCISSFLGWCYVPRRFQLTIPRYSRLK